LRVKVVDTTEGGRPAVNVKMPIGLVKFGLKMAQTFSPDVKKIDLDWDELSTIIEQGALGEIVHVEDDTEHKTVDVWVE
jgi:hypothetical protein